MNYFISILIILVFLYITYKILLPAFYEQDDISSKVVIILVYLAMTMIMILSIYLINNKDLKPNINIKEQESGWLYKHELYHGHLLD